MTGYPDDYWTRAEDLRAMHRDDPPPASIEPDPAWMDNETGPNPGMSIVALTVAATLIGTAGLGLTLWLVW